MTTDQQRVAVVTGAARGIGAGVAGCLAQWAPYPDELAYVVNILVTLSAAIRLRGTPETIDLTNRNTGRLRDDLRIPASAMLGPEGKGFELMMTKLAQERLAQAIRSSTVAEHLIELTVAYTAERKAFGKTIGDMQATQFKLAELKTEAVVGRTFTDRCIALFMEDKLDAVDAAMAKMWLSNLHCRIVDECLQLFGGYGYLSEYGIEKIVRDLRVHRILEGTNEIMRVVVGRAVAARGLGA